MYYFFNICLAKLASLMYTKQQEIVADSDLYKELEKIRKLEKKKMVQNIIKDKLGSLINEFTGLLIKKKTSKFDQEANEANNQPESRPIETKKKLLFGRNNRFNTQNRDDDVESKMSVTLSRFKTLKTKTEALASEEKVITLF